MALCQKDVPICSRLQHRIVLIALWASALCSCFSPAGASLRLVANPARAEVWQRVYDQMPCCWKTDRTIAVQELSGAEMAALVASRSGQESDRRTIAASTVDGCYRRGGSQKGDVGTICLCCSHFDGAQAELVFAHEYGHFIWDEKLTKAQRNAYKRLWQQQKRIGHLVTRYAGANPDEGFAETVAYFLRQPDTLRQCDPSSYQFLTDLLGMEVSATDGHAPPSCCP